MDEPKCTLCRQRPQMDRRTCCVACVNKTRRAAYHVRAAIEGRRVWRCGYCGKPGHNSRTCPTKDERRMQEDFNA